ncbi:MAG: type II toxin-antitoxin system VapC family toxin [Promethearchaeia archaeon]
MIFFDTDICIDILHEKISLSSFIETFSSNEKFAITSPSIFELYMGYYKLQYGKTQIKEDDLLKERRNIQKLVQSLYNFPLNEKAAIKAANIFRKLEASGNFLDPFDCLIASIILVNDFSKILTRNVRHFQRIKGINVIKL